MNYMILAAGKGSRMGELGSYLQKCMFPILDRPFLALVLDSVLANKCFDPASDRVVIVTGYRGDQIESFFTSSWGGIQLRYVDQGPALGTAHAVLAGRSACAAGEPVIIIQGDVWAPPGYFEELATSKAENILSAHPHICSARHDERMDMDGNRVTRAFQGSGPFIESGVWKFSPAMFGYMMSRKADEYRALASVQAAIEDGLEVTAIEQETWIHLGGTEPSVRDNLASVTRFFLGRAPSWC